jgi:hypothetical protein
VSWPVRTRICLECRAALSDGELCTWVRHTAVAPADPEERKKLARAVWGPDADRPRPRGLVAAILQLQPDTDPEARLLGASPVLAVPAPRMAAPRGPYGASEEPLWTSRTRYSGRVAAAAPSAPSPIAGTPCVAYGLWLLDPRADGSPVLLRDGASIAFDVELDDGRLARIAAGTIDLVATGAPQRRGKPGLARYLRHLDPDGPDRRRPSPLPFRQVREAILRPGDALTLLADLQPVPDARAAGTAYRDPAAGVLAPLGRIAIVPAG